MSATVARKDLQVCKKRLQFQQRGSAMNAEFFVCDAKGLAEEMIERELRGPGDVDNAMRRLAQAYPGFSYADLWALRYRPPKEVGAQVWAGLALACADHRRRYGDPAGLLADRYKRERADFAPKSGVARALLRIADAAAGESHGRDCAHETA